MAIVILYLILATSALSVQGDPGRGSIRLFNNGKNSTNVSEGIVEIYYQNKWGTACIDKDAAYGTNTALSVCRQLGYSLGSVSNSQYGTGSPDPVISGVSCTSGELNLLQCDFNDQIGSNCTHNKLAVECSDYRVNYTGRVRLAEQIYYTGSGQVQVYCNGRWGLICESNFAQNDADTICRQLGFTTATERTSSNNEDSLPIWFDTPDCGDSESCISSCTDCPSTELATCSNNNVAGVTCSYESNDSPSGVYEICLLSEAVKHIVGIIVGVVIAFFVCVALIIIIPIICCCCLGVGIGAATRRSKYNTI